jgi:gas vesicle protein
MHTDDIVKIALAATIGAGVGALAMFIFDPDSGRRRRDYARDRATHYGKQATDAVESTARDLRNRARGLASEARGAVSNVMHWTGPERRSQPREPVNPGINQAAGTGAE